MHSTKHWRWLCGVALALMACVCRADLYAFKDDQGVLNITDNKSNIPPKFRSKIRIVPTPTYKKAVASKNTAKVSITYEPTNSKNCGIGWNLKGLPGECQYVPKQEPNMIYWVTTHADGKAIKLNEANRKLYMQDIARIAAQNSLHPLLLHAVITAESGFNPKAVSHAGAMGLMQLMPGTATRFGVGDPFDPIANMQGGARYLRQLLDQFNNNLDLALAAYNAGEGAVMRYGNAIPPYAETKTYVKRVKQYFNHFSTIN
ncbi:MAG: lytic transglycosylase domain-containing protein [Gammaproteobacteria bacterium]